MKWRGIQRGSIDASKSLDEGLLLINGRLKVDGELRRRRGMARSNIVKKGNAVTNISGFSAFQSNVMAALVDGSNLQGYQQPAALWGDNPDYTLLYPAYVSIDFGSTTLDSDVVGIPTWQPGVQVIPYYQSEFEGRGVTFMSVWDVDGVRYRVRFSPTNTNYNIQVHTAVANNEDLTACWAAWVTQPVGSIYGTWSGGYSTSAVINGSSYPATVTVTDIWS